MINSMPPWVLTNPQPAFLESESGSVLQQTAVMYAKVNELVESYNSFTKNIDKAMNDFLIADAQSKQEHMSAIRQEFQDFINIVDLKILAMQNEIRNFEDNMDAWKKQQENIIKNAENYMKNNIVSTTETIVNDALANETIYAKMNYDAENESLSIVFSDDGGGV